MAAIRFNSIVPAATAAGTGTGRSRVHCDPLGGERTQLCASGLVTGTPQTFPVAFPEG
jgi:hypothetical protein